MSIYRAYLHASLMNGYTKLTVTGSDSLMVQESYVSILGKQMEKHVQQRTRV